MPTIYGYARCSTNETKQDIERQIRDLRAKGAEEVFYEYESGAKQYRPELSRLLSRLEEGDSIVTTEVSRITRSLKQLCEVLEFAKKKKLRLVIGNFVIDCSGEIDHMTEAMLQMMGVFSQLERSMTVDRIKSGLAHAKSKGVRLGRPKKKPDEIPQKVLDFWPLYESGSISKVDYARLCSLSRPTIYKYIRLLTDG
jgi:DNA invertase Pin-like site-specific DNA recombinase